MTNTTNKKTNKEMFMALLNVIANAEIEQNDKDELSEFINSRIQQIEKKASTPSKTDLAKAELNARIATDIIAGLTELDKPVKISELIKAYAPLNEFSTQKLTPILSKLVADGKVTKTVVKRDTLYNVA
jgi:hypothetical protein